MTKTLGFVLVVEDDLAQRVLTCATLTDAGFSVESVANMFDALELMAVHRGTYDVIVIGLGLPDSQGLESLHTAVQGSDVPVVVYSGLADPAAPTRARKMGATSFVFMDEAPERLVTAVTHAIGTARPEVVPVPAASADLAGSEDLRTIIARSLTFLAEQVPMGLWMVTRVNGNDWVVIDSVGDTYPIKPGSVMRWSDSFCSRMVQGQGPRMTNDAMSLQVYADAPVASALEIGQYCGIPLVIQGAGLFGTLCGIDPAIGADHLGMAEPMVTHIALMLSTAIAMDLENDRLQRRLDLAKLASRTDALTGLPNRRAFDLMLKVEDARAQRYGHTCAVAMVDLNDLKVVNDTQGHVQGDRLIAQAADALASVTRRSDMVFRIGGDEFALLATPSTTTGNKAILQRIQRALDEVQVSAAIGLANQRPGQPLTEIVAEADELMYANKLAARNPA
ncbi:MAG: diguanylate cyclase domain-containing protein [Euzebya sp.]